MAAITLGGNPIHTNGTLPETGKAAPSFELTQSDLTTTTLAHFKGRKLVLNIFPSLDTGVCATSIRKFNEKAAGLENTSVLCISRDLPFAQARFCGAEGLDNVISLSDYKDGSFGRDYGVMIEDSAFAQLHARAIVVINEDGQVVYTEQVPEVGQEPNYDAALKSL